MVFVVASHSMVVEGKSNPDGTLQRKRNLPKSDLRGKWTSDDQRRALATQEQGGGPNAIGYTIRKTSQAATTRESHTGRGARALPSLLSRPALTDYGSRSPVPRALASAGAPSGFRYDYMEPLTTITERFKSTTERTPLTSYTYSRPDYTATRPDIPLFKTTYTPALSSAYKPLHKEIHYKPPPSPSKAIVPYTARKIHSYPDRSESDIQSYLDRPVEKSHRGVRTALGRVPTTFRGMPLVRATHDVNSRDYLLPISITEAYRPSVSSYDSDYYVPEIRAYEPPEPLTRYYARPLPKAPAGFYRGRRHSLPARPVELDLLEEEDSGYRRRKVPDYYGVEQVYNEPYRSVRPYSSYVPSRSYSLPRRSRTAAIEARLESLSMPEYTPTTYHGLRSRTAEARDKLDRHKVMLDRYTPLYMGPVGDVGMPSLQRTRSSTSSSATTSTKDYTPPKVVPSYRPVSKPQPITKEPSTPPARHRAPPRAVMSDARKRAREVLCKTKKDPSYFNY